MRLRGTIGAAVAAIEERPGEGVFARDGDTMVGLVRPNTLTEGLALDFIRGETRVRVHFADPVRPDTEATLEALEAMGIPAEIVSGNGSACRCAGRRTRLARDSRAPADKLDLLRGQAASGEHVLMVGDGLNDGPALAAAHVSMAPATASDASQQAADAVFLGDGLMPVAIAIRAARATMRVVRQNFLFAVLYNLCAVPLAIAGYVTPLIAALAMSASSFVVIANSLRLARAAR